MRIKPIGLIILGLAVACLTHIAQADHFTVTLDITNGTNKQSAQTETEPPKAGQLVVRPTMPTAVGARCTARFQVLCKNDQTLKDVLIHFYVVKIDKVGQAPPPLEPRDVVLEAAQTMDFAKGTTTSAELQCLIAKPGIYLVRIETQNTAEEKGHEHYAAMDLVAK